MKELLDQKLANQPQNTYPKNSPPFDGGDIFMEGKPDMPPNSQPTIPEHAERISVQKQPASAETQAAARKLLESNDLPLAVRRAAEQVVAGEDVPLMAGAAPEQEEDQGEPIIEDRKAADSIGRFRQEGGEEDHGKIEQLRRDLSQRIDELMKEQWALGDSDEVKTPDGKTRVDAKIDELSDKISQIQGFIAKMFPSQERSRRGDPEIGRIVGASEEFVNGLRGRGLRLDQINDLSRLTPEEKVKRAALVHDIKTFLQDTYSLQSSSFDPDILLAVRHFKELREELISDIIFKSFEDRSETNEYEVNLYADSNLNTLMGFLSKDDNERYRDFFSLRTATRFFQSMNATVLKGTFDSFGQAAENINYQHFENMRDIRGSGLAMRLYEQAYRDVLAGDKRVTQDKIAGIKEFVETTFKEMNKAGLVTSEYSKYRADAKMEDWEIQRALAAGRSFLNITLRTAEIIATGQVPEGRKQYSSPPQEDMVRILNWNHWFLIRFDFGKARHGLDFLRMSTDRYQKFLRYRGTKLGKNKIIEFGGVDVGKMEEGSQYRTSGVYSGWRLETMAFNEIKFFYKGKRMSVQEFTDMDETQGKLAQLKAKADEENKKSPNRDPKDQITKEIQGEYRDIFKPVVDNLNLGLSMLLKNGRFGMPEENNLGYLLRTEIWKKISQTNTPLMIDYLTDIKYPNDASDKAISMEELRKSMGSEWTGENSEKWGNFRKKALVKFERMIKEGMGENLVPIAKDYEFNKEEEILEKKIRKEGGKLAPHLADMVFPYTPFMNDMPFENFRYDYPGQTFYKRRTTGDLGGFNKGQQAFMKIMSNPGGIPAKEAVAAMGEIVEGISGPEGTGVGIEANFPTFSALLDVVATDPGKRQAMFKMLLEATRQSTSIAQRWAGVKADSFTEVEAANLVDDTVRAGILTPKLARYLKKEKKLLLSGILWMLFRDVFILVPVFATKEFIGTLKEK